MANHANEAGLLVYASMRKLVEQTEQTASEVLTAVEGRPVSVEIEAAHRQDSTAIQSLLASIATEGPCLCCPVFGELDARLAIWPPYDPSDSSWAWSGKHQLVAETLTCALIPALHDLTGIPLHSGELRLKHEMCSLPEDWGDEADAWLWSGSIGNGKLRSGLRFALIAPTADILALFTTLCLEDAA